MCFLCKVVKSAIVVLIMTVVFASTPEALESNASPLQFVFMIKQLMPQVQTIGVMWNQTRANTGELTPKIERASASVGVKVVVEDVEDLRDVSEKFRELKEKYNAQALWIIEADDPLDNGIGKDFLVKNSIVNGIALFAPNTDWVSDGACASLATEAGNVKLYVNKKTIAALGIKVPDKLVGDTQFVGSN